jgi:hypothetical protein
MSIDAAATANVVCDDEFGFRIQCKPQHRAAPLCGSPSFRCGSRVWT